LQSSQIRSRLLAILGKLSLLCGCGRAVLRASATGLPVGAGLAEHVR
jgi:hypothetical protein